MTSPFLVLFLASAGLGQLPAPLLAHADALSRIKTMHVKIEVSAKEGADAAAQIEWTAEAWRAGFRERAIQRTYTVQEQEQDPSVATPTRDDVTMLGFTDREVRNVSGWDPERPYRLPLDFARNAGAFARVKCSLGTRDPMNSASDVWRMLLLEFSRGLSVPNLEESSELSPIRCDLPGVHRFQVMASQSPNADGAVFDIDAHHGHMVRRIAWKGSWTATVDEFKEYRGGIWLPVRVERTFGSVSMITKVIEAHVNGKMSDAELSLEFPEGARVDEPEKSRVHLWGKYAPAKTFTNVTDFSSYLDRHAREVQSASATEPRTAFLRRPVLWLNAILAILLFALIALRRKLASKEAAR